VSGSVIFLGDKNPMPYSIDNPPKAVKNLPKKAIAIWVAAFDAAYNEYNKDEKKAFAVAWAATKKKYKKNDAGKWVKKKADLIVSKGMIVAKCLVKNGVVHWKSTMSSDSEDDVGDILDKSIFADFVSNFTPDSVPVDVSHYTHYLPKDVASMAVVGTAQKMYVDGRYLKGAGVFNDSPIAKAAVKSLMNDNDKKIRVSIVFSPDMNRIEHNGENTIYKGGDGKAKIVSLGLTSVPINPDTEIALQLREDISMKSDVRRKHIKNDALDVLGDEDIVETLENARLGRGVSKSDADDGLIVKSETGDTEQTEDVNKTMAADTVATSPDTEHENVTDDNQVEQTESKADVIAQDSPEILDKSKMWLGESPPSYAAALAQDALASNLEDMFNILADVIRSIYYDSNISDKEAFVNKALDEFRMAVASLLAKATSPEAKKAAIRVVTKSDAASYVAIEDDGISAKMLSSEEVWDRMMNEHSDTKESPDMESLRKNMLVVGEQIIAVANSLGEDEQPTATNQEQGDTIEKAQVDGVNAEVAEQDQGQDEEAVPETVGFIGEVLDGFASTVSGIIDNEKMSRHGKIGAIQSAFDSLGTVVEQLVESTTPVSNDDIVDQVKAAVQPIQEQITILEQKLRMADRLPRSNRFSRPINDEGVISKASADVSKPGSKKTIDEIAASASVAGAKGLTFPDS